MPYMAIYGFKLPMKFIGNDNLVYNNRYDKLLYTRYSLTYTLINQDKNMISQIDGQHSS